ncbi:hypothetical protein P7C70_g5407, partial [Phenoliferia sp. Uapishka_3]
MSMDRKNKRAAQAALREANSDGVATNAPGTSSSPSSQPPTSPPQQPRQSLPPQQLQQSQSGIGLSLKNSLELERPSVAPSSGVGAVGDQNGWGTSSRPQLSSTTNGNSNGLLRTISSSSPSATSNAFPQQGLLRSPPTRSEATIFGTTSSAENKDEHRSPPPPSMARLAPTFPTNGPSGLSQTLGKLPSTNGNGRSTVAAQVMLSQQGRRLSESANSALDSSPSPSRLTRGGFSSELFAPSGSGSPAVPLAAPKPNPSTSSSGIFSTSPFSGSRSLFLPSSYDSGSGDDAFPRSPPRLGGQGQHRGGFMERGESNSTNWDGRVFSNHEEGGEEGDDSSDEFEDQGFLPSSLVDLLTPEEQRRRASKMAFDPFQNSRSVPAELLLANGRPTMNGNGTIPHNAWGTLTNTSSSPPPNHAYATSPPPQRSLLSASYAFATSPPHQPSPLPSSSHSNSFLSS